MSAKAPSRSRNESCPCGSGKRFKRCHGLLELYGIQAFGPDPQRTPSAEDVIKLAERLREKEQLRLERRKKFGEVELTNSVVVHDRRLVAVAGGIYLADERMNPAEFMARHLAQSLGHDWLREQLTGPEGATHPVVDWYNAVLAWQRQVPSSDGYVNAANINGPALAWFLLAYDVWVLSHYRLLSSLLNRLRDRRQFQGARYEITTYAHFVRAGFSIQPEDETDNRSKHVEFIAQHKESGEYVAVEAKSRHRPGVLGHTIAGYDLNAAPRPSIENLLRNALAKQRGVPYVVFLDLNLPPSTSLHQSEERMDAAASEVASVIQEYECSGEKFPATAVILTNYAHHYGALTEAHPAHDQVQVGIPMAMHPFRDTGTWDRILAAMQSYGQLPSSWREFD